MEDNALKALIVEVIDEMITPNPVEIGKRWQGGKLIITPSNDSQSKEIPLEVFFKKLIGVKESLRVLEQKLNNHPDLSQEDKLSFQSYLTKACGSLTTFNILFKEDKDKFYGAGSGKETENSASNMSLSEAKRKLGLNEY